MPQFLELRHFFGNYGKPTCKIKKKDVKNVKKPTKL